MLFQRIQRERNFGVVQQELYPMIKGLFGLQADAYVVPRNKHRTVIREKHTCTSVVQGHGRAAVHRGVLPQPNVTGGLR